MPILMYHYISTPPPGADVYRRDLSVAPERFRDHLDRLLGSGYQVITLDDLLYALAQGRSLRNKPDERAEGCNKNRLSLPELPARQGYGNKIED